MMKKVKKVKVISIRQPWAWLVASGLKDIENRDWPTRFRGPVAIHAGKRIPYLEEVWEIEDEFGIKLPTDFDVGGIIGFATVKDCVSKHSSKWFFGSFGFVLSDARLCRFFPCPGRLGFFDLDVPHDLKQSSPVNIPVILEPELFQKL